MSEEITQWEYKEMSARHYNDETLNKIGSEGWEMVTSTTSGGGTFSFIFKKPKPKQNQPSYDGYSR